VSSAEGVDEMMNCSLLLRAGVRHLIRKPLASAMAFAGIALGVAAVTGLDIAIESVLRAFERVNVGLSTRTTHRLVSAQGPFEESLYATLKRARPTLTLTPIVSGEFRHAGNQHGSARGRGSGIALIGTDPLALGGASLGLLRGGSSAVYRSMPLTLPVLASAEALEQLRIDVGGHAIGTLGGRDVRIHVIALIGASKGEADSLGPMLVADIAPTQELLGKFGVLDRVEVGGGREPLDDALAEKIARTLPARMRLEAKADRFARLETVSSAFRLNLRMLGLLAAGVGCFLAFSAFKVLVAGRERSFLVMLALGLTPRTLRVAICLEATAFGILAGLAGLISGMLLAGALLPSVSSAASAHYAVDSFAVPLLDAGRLLGALALGVLATVIAGWSASRDLLSMQPARLLRARNPSFVSISTLHDRRPGPASVAGLLTALLGVGVMIGSEDSQNALAIAFVALAVIVLGLGLSTPQLWRFIRGVAEHATLGSVLLTTAWRRAARNLERYGVTVTALALVLGTTISVQLMVGSFRAEVTHWLQARLNADLYVQVSSVMSAAQRRWVEKRLRGHPAVERAVVGTWFDTHTPAGAIVKAHATEIADADIERYELEPRGYRTEPGAEEARRAWRSLAAGRGVWLSLPLARRLRLFVGDDIMLRGHMGIVRRPVTGVFRDFATDQGFLLVSESLRRAVWPQTVTSGYALHLRPGESPDAFGAQALGDDDSIRRHVDILSTARLRERALTIFDRTFVIASRLSLISVAIGVFGIICALVVRYAERSAERRLVTALGVSGGQQGLLMLVESIVVSTVAFAMACPIGIALALFLTDVVNIRAFGWHFPLLLSLKPFLNAFTISVGTGVLAGAIMVLSIRHQQRSMQ
jgi:putative ABC transport system permease protein